MKWRKRERDCLLKFFPSNWWALCFPLTSTYLSLKSTLSKRSFLLFVKQELLLICFIKQCPPKYKFFNLSKQFSSVSFYYLPLLSRILCPQGLTSHPPTQPSLCFAVFPTVAVSMGILSTDDRVKGPTSGYESRPIDSLILTCTSVAGKLCPHRNTHVSSSDNLWVCVLSQIFSDRSCFCACWKALGRAESECVSTAVFLCVCCAPCHNGPAVCDLCTQLCAWLGFIFIFLNKVKDVLLRMYLW